MLRVPVSSISRGRQSVDTWLDIEIEKGKREKKKKTKTKKKKKAQSPLHLCAP